MGGRAGGGGGGDGGLQRNTEEYKEYPDSNMPTEFRVVVGKMDYFCECIATFTFPGTTLEKTPAISSACIILLWTEMYTLE